MASVRQFLRRSASASSTLRRCCPASSSSSSSAAAYSCKSFAITGSVQSLRPAFGLVEQQRRSYGTRSSSAADSYLVEVLKSEIEHELHEEADKQGSLKGSPGPFELSDKPGTEEVILRRTFGNEQIAVTCVVESEYPEEDEETEDDEAGQNEENEREEEDTASQTVGVLHLNVTITKEASTPALEIQCTFMRGTDEVTIDSVSFLNKDASDEDGPRPYEGPQFEDLDENLQRAFHDLLKARGLSAKVATYVMDYLTVKEHREYMRWLHNLETFFSS